MCTISYFLSFFNVRSAQLVINNQEMSDGFNSRHYLCSCSSVFLPKLSWQENYGKLWLFCARFRFYLKSLLQKCSHTGQHRPCRTFYSCPLKFLSLFVPGVSWIMKLGAESLLLFGKVFRLMFCVLPSLPAMPLSAIFSHCCRFVLSLPLIILSH